MKTLHTNLIVLIFGITFVISCEEGQPLGNAEFAEADTMLVGPTWQLVAFVEDDGDRTAIDYDSIISGFSMIYAVIFTKQPSAECLSEVEPLGIWCMEVIGYPNTGFFTYELKSTKEQSFAIYFHGATQINQFPDSKEPEFFKALQAAKSYRINGTQLRIFYDNRKALLFEPLESEKK